jgi:hypothetical protein
MRRIALFLMLSFSVCAQTQIDKSTTTLQDLGDQKEAARAETEQRLKVTDGALPILQKKMGSNPGDDLLAEAPFIQLRLMTCLIKGDYNRHLSAIYSKAADAAANAAKEIDAKTQTPAAPSADAEKARQELNESIRREAELRRRTPLNGVERVELDALPAYIQRLRDTVAIYDDVEKSRSKDARTGGMADQMRENVATSAWKPNGRLSNRSWKSPRKPWLPFRMARQCAAMLSKLKAGPYKSPYNRVKLGVGGRIVRPVSL